MSAGEHHGGKYFVFGLFGGIPGEVLPVLEGAILQTFGQEHIFNLLIIFRQRSC